MMSTYNAHSRAQEYITPVVMFSGSKVYPRVKGVVVLAELLILIAKTVSFEELWRYVLFGVRWRTKDLVSPTTKSILSSVSMTMVHGSDF